jgi:hypothetical protein
MQQNAIHRQRIYHQPNDVACEKENMGERLK